MPEKYKNIYKAVRLCTNLTQEAAAERIGVSVESIRTYETGRRIPPVISWSGWWSVTVRPSLPTSTSMRRRT